MLRKALDGLTVLDFTQIAAGPTATMLMADTGARVKDQKIAAFGSSYRGDVVCRQQACSGLLLY